MIPKNAKHPPVSAIDTIPVAISMAPNREHPNGLHVAKSNAGRSAVQHDEDSKPDPVISTNLTFQDDATRDDKNGKREVPICIILVASARRSVPRISKIGVL